MIIVERGGVLIGIPQPAHALLSGALARAWVPGALPPGLAAADILLAAEQHDLGWLPWESAPTRDPGTGLPWDFRRMPAAEHAPMWAEGVRVATASYGPLVGWLVSRHGTRVYRRGVTGLPDAPEAAAFIVGQEAVQRSLAVRGRFDPEAAERGADLVAAVDFLSLRACFGGGGPIPDAPMPDGRTTLDLAGGPERFALSPWPFGVPVLTGALDGIVLPKAGFSDQATMRTALTCAARVRLPVLIAPGG